MKKNNNLVIEKGYMSKGEKKTTHILEDGLNSEVRHSQHVLTHLAKLNL